ncbi:MAG: hypothetical protein K2Q45_09030 [Nitrosomonas sp.]|nr:hypothetical protein [Nitrosomonas sp.]
MATTTCLSSKVECIGFPASRLTADQVSKINAVVESQPIDALIAVRVFSNLDTTNDEENPSGMQLIFKPEAKVDATLIGDNLFQVFAVARIYSNKPLKDEDFTKRTKDLAEAVDQFPAKPLNAGIRSLKTNTENDTWAPELGGPGSFVGVYSKAKDGDHRNKEFFIAARGTVPLLVKDLKQRIGSAAGGVTFRELLFDEDWRKIMQYNQQAARRNVFRTIANAAEACEVTIRREPDMYSKLMDPNHAHPEMAMPDWEQETHTIRSGVYNNKPVALVSYGIVPSEDCLLLKDQLFFVVANPYDGVAAFKLSEHENIQSALGLPADTGRRLPAEQVPRKEQDYKGRMEGVSWDTPKGSIASAIHVDVHPLAFNTIDADFKNTMQSMGWDASNHIDRLVPLALKIYFNK